MAKAFLEQTRLANITKPLQPEVLIPVIWGTVVTILKQAWEGHLSITQEVRSEVEQVLWDAVCR